MSIVEWQTKIDAVASRYNREYQRESFDVPEEVEAMPIFQEWTAGHLGNRIATPFWELAQPKKKQRCLDLGCGFGFLIYPWREWDAFFYGQEVSIVARDTLNSRAPQLNSKLFKGVQLGGAHQLPYEENQFDLAIATGFSCYYPLDYWQQVMLAVRKVLRPEGTFVFDVLNPDIEWSENWAILEMYLGAEAFLEPIDQWQSLIKESGAKILKTHSGELFQGYKVQFS